MKTLVKKLYGENHYRVAQEWLAFANWSKAFSRFKDIKRYLENGEKVMLKNFPPEHSMNLLVDLEFAKLDMERAKFDDAEQKYKDAIRKLESSEEDVTSLLLPAYGQIAIVYRETDREFKIKELIEKAVLISPYQGANLKD